MKLLLVLINILAFLLFILVEGLIVTGLWNSVIPDIFGLPIINNYQGLCITLLSWMLFKSFNTSTKGK